MKEFVWAVIYFCGGAVVSLGLYALIAVGATKEREYDIYREGFAEGHRTGLMKCGCGGVEPDLCSQCQGFNEPTDEEEKK